MSNTYNNVIDEELSPNQTLYCEGLGETIKIIELIGFGGQSHVYKVSTSKGIMALKLLFKMCSSEGDAERIKKIINNPIDSELFIWPKYFIKYNERIGYLMDLILEDYTFISIYDHFSNVNTPVEIFSNISNYLTCAINIAKGIYLIHKNQYIYNDLSYNNVYINPDNGKVLFIDNDNICPNLTNTNLRGTKGFIAPELIENSNNETPNRYTELYSLAVLIFYLLFFILPLVDNNCEADDDYEIKTFGKNAIYLFEDENNILKYLYSNEKWIGELWNLYPKSLTDLFRKCFTTALSNRNARVGHLEWIESLYHALGTSYICPHCGFIHFIETDELQRRGYKPICSETNKVVYLPIIKIQTGNKLRYIVLNDQTKLYKRYFKNYSDYLCDDTDEGLIVKYNNSCLTIINHFPEEEVEVYYLNCRTNQKYKFNYQYIVENIEPGDKIFVGGTQCVIAIPR